MLCCAILSMYKSNKSPWFLGAMSMAACFALVACGSTVVGGGSGGSGANTTTTVASSGSGSGMGGQGGSAGSGGSGTAGGNPGSSNAISMLYSELQSPNPAGGTTVASTSGGGPDPNTLYIAISDTLQSCSDPYAAGPCGNHYKVMLGIPVALQQVGIINLNDPSIISNFSWAGVEDQPGQCPGGGGSFWDGELEITDIDQTHVAGVLTNTSTFDFDANGPFDAPRCVF